MINPAKIENLVQTMGIKIKETENGWRVDLDSSPRSFVAKSDEEMIDIVRQILEPYRSGIATYNLEPIGGIDTKED